MRSEAKQRLRNNLWKQSLEANDLSRRVAEQAREKLTGNPGASLVDCFAERPWLPDLYELASTAVRRTAFELLPGGNNYPARHSFFADEHPRAVAYLWTLCGGMP